MTPLEIGLLLHIHCRPLWYENPDAPAVREAIGDFMLDGLIANDTLRDGPEYHPYSLTPRGRAYVLALCNVPCPEQCWRLPGTDTVLC